MPIDLLALTAIGRPTAGSATLSVMRHLGPLVCAEACFQPTRSSEESWGGMLFHRGFERVRVLVRTESLIERHCAGRSLVGFIWDALAVDPNKVVWVLSARQPNFSPK